MFKPEEFSIVGATTGQEGLTLVQSEKPDLILLDIMPPGGMNGFDVLEKLEADPSSKQIPVIVLTNLDSGRKSRQNYRRQRLYCQGKYDQRRDSKISDGVFKVWI